MSLRVAKPPGGASRLQSGVAGNGALTRGTLWAAWHSLRSPRHDRRPCKSPRQRWEPSPALPRRQRPEQPSGRLPALPTPPASRPICLTSTLKAAGQSWAPRRRAPSRRQRRWAALPSARGPRLQAAPGGPAAGAGMQQVAAVARRDWWRQAALVRAAAGAWQARQRQQAAAREQAGRRQQKQQRRRRPTAHEQSGRRQQKQQRRRDHAALVAQCPTARWRARCRRGAAPRAAATPPAWAARKWAASATACRPTSTSPLWRPSCSLGVSWGEGGEGGEEERG